MTESLTVKLTPFYFIYRTTNCKWKFITEAGLRFIVGVTDTVKDTGDEIKFEDTNGLNFFFVYGT